MSVVLRTNRVITLIVTCLGNFMVLLDTTIIVTALPTIQSNLHTNLSDLQWATDAFTLSFAALLLTGGTLGDRFGPLASGLAFLGWALPSGRSLAAGSSRLRAGQRSFS